ncbi:hypothetical protein P0136_13560 [Lentisphaerota bacterium ZTH]|nr:hypothetical protein JYG24_08925 [Lentisphaerota bacterium]WET06384.1 hypothetical protein P0136_13560 [Lentisphaerota bacterium ZTH]
MKKISVMIVMVMLLAAGCVNITYLGQKYQPTKKVTFYYSWSIVPTDRYTVIGKAIEVADEDAWSSEIHDDLIEKAESVGADAVVIDSMHRKISGRVVNYSNPWVDYYDWNCNNYWGGPFYYNSPMSYWGTSGVNVYYNYDTVIVAKFLKNKTFFEKHPEVKPTE